MAAYLRTPPSTRNSLASNPATSGRHLCAGLPNVPRGINGTGAGKVHPYAPVLPTRKALGRQARPRGLNSLRHPTLALPVCPTRVGADAPKTLPSDAARST